MGIAQNFNHENPIPLMNQRMEICIDFFGSPARSDHVLRRKESNGLDLFKTLKKWSVVELIRLRYLVRNQENRHSVHPFFPIGPLLP